MTVEAAFDALRDYKRELTGEGLSEADVAAFNTIFATWHRPAAPANPTALTDASKFFAAVRAAFGPLSQSQVDGIQTLLQAFGEASWPIAFVAYGLSTAWHETNAQMQPVAEAYYLGGKADAYRKTLRYYPFYGRGYPQITWEANYRHADTALGLGGALVANPDLALRPDIAGKIMVWGMETGSFSGKALKDYLPISGEATLEQFTRARPIINVMDQAAKIANEAVQFQKALKIGGWR